MKPKPKTESERAARFAKGGKDHMVKPQAAGPAKPARTGKIPTAAPGKRAAVGGKPPHVGGLSLPASPGRTGPGSDD